ncbi:hypothetical protein LJC20_02560 [Eubacteriales bacterium OttesenSCG-928-M02]|nr:hypothetical protein [Eubacteriales bacterium OttesenSCG-928-M02]
MKQFYGMVSELFKKHAEAGAAYNARIEEINNSTASDERKATDLAILKEQYDQSTKINTVTLGEVIAETRERISAELNTWKHGENPALTNVLLMISAADSDAAGSLPLDSMTKAFADDYISTNAIKGALRSKGVPEYVVERVQSNYGENPLRELDAFESRAGRAFTDKNTLFTLAHAAEQGMDGKPVTLTPTSGTMF